MPKRTAMVVASGRSERFGGTTPKLLLPWRGRPLLAWTLQAIASSDAVTDLVLVASEQVEAAWTRGELTCTKPCRVVRGGETRQDSVAAGLSVLDQACELVLIHDGARPFVSSELVTQVAEAAERAGAALPLVPISDTVKEVRRPAGESPSIVGTIDRETLGLAQTPQGFRVSLLRAAHQRAVDDGAPPATDDIALVETLLGAQGGGEGSGFEAVWIEAVPGEVKNVKVTRPSDLPQSGPRGRMGLGHDMHRLEVGRAFVLAGVDLHAGSETEDQRGPVGHSDGDVLTHAICDALLGALGMGDIGTLFPDTAAENAGRRSLEFLAEVVSRVASEGWRVVNISAVLKLQRPKVSPHAAAIRAALAEVLQVPASDVGLSAKTGEGLGDIGTERAVSCDVVALLESTP